MAKSNATTPEDYLAELPQDRAAALRVVRDAILANLPEGYEETMLFGMLTYVVPLSIKPDTYNKQPLMYAALGNQKNHMAVYLTNVYGDEEIKDWFIDTYKATGKKLDMGKSCIRFKKLEQLPVSLIGETIAKTSIDDFLTIYENSRRK